MAGRVLGNVEEPGRKDGGEDVVGDQSPLPGLYEPLSVDVRQTDCLSSQHYFISVSNLRRPGASRWCRRPS